MHGGLLFPHVEVRISASERHTLQYDRFLASIFPLSILAVLLVVCMICAECCGKCGKRKRKVKDHESPAQRPRPDYSERFLSPDSNSREDLLKTPSESGDDEGPPSFDFMNASFGYGNSSMVKSEEVRSDLEGAYEAPRATPEMTTTPPFANVRPTPPGLFRKTIQEEEEGDEPDESRSPSPQTLIRQGKKMRYGAWIRTPSTTSTTSDSSQSTMFQMSMSDDEAKRAEEKARARKKLLREKRRLKRERKDDQAEIVRQQINWTVKDEYDQRMRESRAVNIPPRKRIEEHPEFQRIKMEMVDENNAEFDATTVLNSAWERGRMEEFWRKNPGYGPDQTGAEGGEDFSTLLRDVKVEPEDAIEELNVDDTQLSLPQHVNILPGLVAKGKAAQDLSQYSERKICPISDDDYEAFRDMSPYYVKKEVPVSEDEDEASQPQHGARRKVPPKTGAKGKASEDLSQYYVKKEVPVSEDEDEASQPPFQHYHLPVKRVIPETKGEASQPLLHPHGARGKAHEGVGGKKRKACVDNSQPLFDHYGAGKNYGTMVPEVHHMGVFTAGMRDTSVPLVIGKEFEEKRISETRKVSSKIADAVFAIEMERIQDKLNLLNTMKKDGEKHVVEIHQEPSSSGLRRKQSPVVKKDIHVVEIHQEPSSSGLIRRKQSPVVKKDMHVVEIHQKPSSSGLMRRKPSTEVEEDTVIDLGDGDTSSSWEDISPEEKYVWWAGIADRKKKGTKEKKRGKK